MHPANDLNLYYQNQVDVHPAIDFNVFSIQCNIRNSVFKPGPCIMKFSYHKINSMVHVDLNFVKYMNIISSEHY